MIDPACPYVSRGGLKLAAALSAFDLRPQGWVCADLGCSTGGFTDCLLRHGAAHVYALDTSYGQFDYRLRVDTRVTLFERCNALHFEPWSKLKPGYAPPTGGESLKGRNAEGAVFYSASEDTSGGNLEPQTSNLSYTSGGFTGCDLVTLDLGWTRQALALPAAIRWLRRVDPPALADSDTSGGSSLPLIISLIKPHYEAQTQQVRGQRKGILPLEEAQSICDKVLAQMPVLGLRVLGCIPSPIKGKAGKGEGNQEYLALLQRAKP
jgi:23S rRNA (cytidine1920-2'-O)/16S rRNA (cytidine1409-2'-O)-methyltransferase